MSFIPELSWLKLTDNENEGNPVYVRVDLIQIFGPDGIGTRIQVANDSYVLVSEAPDEVAERIVELVSGHP